jgi:hypothetical protein
MEQIIGMNNDELVKFINETPGHFSDYSSLYHYLQFSEESRRGIFINLFDGLNIDFNNKSVIDIGPGSGESLQIAKERGASKTSFVDRDEIISLYCTNLGHTHYKMDYVPFIVEKEENTIPQHDILITKGSFDFDWVNIEDRFNNKVLLDWFDKLSKELIIVIPTWSYKYNHTCDPERFELYLKTPLHECFINNGYKSTFIEGCNDTERFPITYIKTK